MFQQGAYGDQGGGYMNSPGGGLSQGGTSRQANRSRAQNVLPCTIAQIYSAEKNAATDAFTIDGVEVHQVTFVGIVTSVKETPTRLDCDVDDHTGPPIEVRQFVDSELEGGGPVPLRENTYVRVSGHVRMFGDKKSVAAFRIEPLTDMNELTAHVLEVIQVHAYNNSKRDAGLKTDLNGGFGVARLPKPGGAFVMETADMSGLTAVQKQVQTIIRGSTDEHGVSLSVVADRLRGTNMIAIREAVEFLSAEGHIYSTIDDEHYRSTDS